MPEAHIYAGTCKWFALFTESGSERKATIWLKQRNHYPYWPRYMGQVKLRRQRRGFRWRSVIPGYLFLAIPEPFIADWEAIEETPGVRGVMRKANWDLVEFKPKDIEDINRIEKALNESPIAANEGIPLRVSQRVRIRSGIFKGHETTVVAIEKKRKITVEVPMFGTKARIVLPASELEAV